VVGANTGSGVSHGAGPDGQLDPEERWLRLWAYGTSPHGLGVDPRRFWSLTVREFHALQQVHKAALMRWAIERAQFMNANFVHGDDEKWTPEDFLGEGDRAKRQNERFMSQAAAQQANINLLKIRKGAPPTEDVPIWARG
jgi:hypothetical protein